MKTSSQDILITKNGLYTNDNQQENDINSVIAETADSNIKNLNDPNLMSVIEKQYSIAQFAGLTSQYNVLVQNAKDDGIDTTAVTTAYNNLNQFMASVLADPDHASDIDRVAYKKYQDAYNQELANIQNVLQNNANNKFASAASATSQAASTASQAFSQANSAIGVANGATAEITKLSGDINLKVTKDGLIDQINMQAGNTLISSSGQLTLAADTVYFDTKKPVIIPSANIDTLLVDKKLMAADISAKTFTTNNGTFTVDKNGAITATNMTINGGTLTSPTINASTINGATINGAIFNAGTKLNQYGNTSYPLTINPDGSVTSTSFEIIANETAALRTVIKDGIVQTNSRGMTPIGGTYGSANAMIGHGQVALYEGFSNSPDPNFNRDNPEVSTGYVILNAATGLNLQGTTQSIHFSGTDQDATTGITMDSYGNVYGNSASAWWRVHDSAGSQVASFGIDSAGSNDIQFNRSLDIGNFNINTYHTITSSDNGPIHFNRANGNPVDIYASTVHYDSLVKSSLLSVKRDVKKADTAYWAQLVNSIDLATYQYKSDDNTSHIRLSSIVDDVNGTKQWRLPDIFINRDENGKLNGVDDSVLLNATLATVQEQQKEIGQLNGHNMELEARLNKLEVKLNE